MATKAARFTLSAKDDGKIGGSSWMSKALMERRTIIASRQVSDQLAQDVISRLLILEHLDAAAPVTVIVNSPGGAADSGFAIYDALKFVTCPVRTICMGLCASAGVTIFMGGDKGKKLATPYSRFMLHQPSTGAIGQASDLEITAKEILRIRDVYSEIVEKETGIPRKKLIEDANRDFWMSAATALEYGLVDRIVTSADELARG